MFKKLVNTILRIANAKSDESSDSKDKEYSKADLIAWACGCMKEGLPDKFSEAYVEYIKSDDDTNIVDHKYKKIRKVILKLLNLQIIFIQSGALNYLTSIFPLKNEIGKPAK